MVPLFALFGYERAGMGSAVSTFTPYTPPIA
jgi:hypothetical protein